MNTGDTIVAMSCGAGEGLRAVVRMSGTRALERLCELADVADAPGGAARWLRVWPTAMGRTGPSVFAWVYTFRAPRSYTGEDTVEFHLAASPALVRMLLDRLGALGARTAQPGEFTARAFFNGRMDLTAAEGVAAVIGAQNRRELLAARQLMAGELARRLSPVMDEIAHALALVEVGIDFSDQDVSFIDQGELAQKCLQAAADLQAILSQSTRFERLSHEPTVVLAGRPNAGKSTLLNALAGHERAVVSDQAGTTRDAIWAHVRLASGTVRMVDIAGLHADEDSQDAAPECINRQMRQQALRAMEQADLIVLLRAANDSRDPVELPRPPDMVVRSRADLAPGFVDSEAELHVSATTGLGIDRLRQMLDQKIFGGTGTGNILALNARHVQAIEEAAEALRRSAQAADAGAELCALGLREALESLGMVVGQVSPDDLLGKIFARFCIGK